MGAYTFRRARERLVAKLKESDTYSYEQLNDMKVPQIKEILDSKKIEYKSNDAKKELIAYLVEVPEDNQDTKDPVDPTTTNGDNNVDPD
ncbi:HeH/LEM domain-containing protein [Rummeliibacillus sp. NPDC094406]|uniref:HeH/LEM domain-containing protein n=1 Tax=Rummeliibacillus sp. NPDC094406 TaxID=3364511 RepID=UPI00382F2A03